MPRSERLRALELLREKARRKRLEARLLGYRPYPKQLEFHAAGKEHRERLLMAANQVGKSVSGAAETAMHLTGLYPDWWPGRRFDRPTQGWAAGVTNETTRDNPQRLLIGPPRDRAAWGTGFIPGTRFVGEPSRALGIADAVDGLSVRHVSGGTSLLSFKSYEKGREKWQGPTLDFIWFDEEPPQDIYTEGLTRTNATNGPVWLTFTPLEGMSEVVRMFLADEKGLR